MIGYRNACYNPREQTVEVYTWSEEGDRISFTTKFSPYFFIEDSKGDEMSIYNTKLRKKSFNNSFDKTKYLKETGMKRLYENFGATQHCLIDLYWKNNEDEDFSKFPLKTYYIDIEAVAETFPNPSTAEHPINVITIYDSLREQYYSWGLHPYNNKNKAVNYYYCKSEVDLLCGFIDFFKKDPCDILSGWNCLEGNQHVWLSDRIIKIKNLSNNYENKPLKKYGNHINNFMHTGAKEEYKLTTQHGHEILSSIDHRFMVYTRHRDDYKNYNTLTADLKELSVEQIIEQQKTHDVYVKRVLGKNTNDCITYGAIIEGLDLPESSIVTQNADTYTLNFTKSKRACDDFVINKDEKVSCDILQLLGFIFTDGTFNTREKTYRYTSKYNDIICSYTCIFNKEHETNLTGSTECKTTFNGRQFISYSKQVGMNNKLGVLHRLIYNDQNKKQPHIEMLSRLSYKQFMSFMSGMIDGDGWIGRTHIGLCNYDCKKYNFLHDLSELLLWNGIQTHLQKNSITIAAHTINEKHIKSLRLMHAPRRSKLQELSFYSKKNKSSNNIEWMAGDGEYVVRLKPVEKTGRVVDMYDIETKDHVFLCNGTLTHNCANFDIPYIVNRIRNVLGDAAVNELSPVKRVFARSFMGNFGKEQLNYHIDGISCVDYLDVYKRFSFTNRESYKLDYIGELELGEKKVDYGDRDLFTLMKEDWDLFIDYNIQDVRLLVNLEKKLQYINLLRMLAYVGLTTFEGAMGTLSVITGGAAIRARLKGQRVSTFIRGEDDGSKNPGAYVAEPLPGFQENIVSFDANSLYPNVMISLNMSPETKVGKIVETDETHITIRHVNGQVFKLTKDKFAKFVKKEEIAISRAKILFSQKSKGIIPDMVDHYYQKRKEVQAEMEKYERELETIEKQLKQLH